MALNKDQRRVARRLRNIQRPTDAPALLQALRDLFPGFGDQEFESELESGEAGLHGVMREFSWGVGLDRATEKQLLSLADLLSVCVAEDDELENAVSTCFLEHLSRKSALWPHLSPTVRRHGRA